MIVTKQGSTSGLSRRLLSRLSVREIEANGFSRFHRRTFCGSGVPWCDLSLVSLKASGPSYFNMNSIWPTECEKLYRGFDEAQLVDVR